MVRYIKENFFVRYREFENLTHLNQLAEHWLREEADQLLHGTVKGGVAQRFVREWSNLQALPAMRFDTAYRERRVVAWDGSSRCAATATACRANCAERWSKCASDSTAQWQFITAKANWLRGIGSSPPPTAGCWCPSIIACCG